MAQKDFHGFITDLSPIKSTNPPIGSGRDPTTYFYGNLQTSQNSYRRVVCFDETKFDMVKKAEDEQSYMTVSKCSTDGKEPDSDVKIFKTSQVKPSKTVPRFAFKARNHVVDIATTKTLKEDDRVDIKAKVLVLPDVDDKGGRDVILTDKTGTIKLRLWSKNVDALECSKVYQFKSLQITKFKSEKQLAFGAESSRELLENHELQGLQAKQADAIKSSIVVDSCMVNIVTKCKCGFEVKPNSGDQFYKCTKCDLKTKITKLSNTLKIKVVDENGKTYIIPKDALDATKQKLPSDDLESYLLETENFDITMSRGLITSIRESSVEA